MFSFSQLICYLIGFTLIFDNLKIIECKTGSTTRKPTNSQAEFLHKIVPIEENEKIIEKKENPWKPPPLGYYTYDSDPTKTVGSTSTPQNSFIDMYHAGVSAYSTNDWEACVSHLEGALYHYRQYYDAVTACRVSCDFKRQRHQTKWPSDIDIGGNSGWTAYDYGQQYKFFEGLIVKTLCLEKCRRHTMPLQLPAYFEMGSANREIFRDRRIYEYLQLCYYREHDVKKAISAAYTVLTLRPNDALMKRNLKYYSTLPGFNMQQMIDLEDRSYSKYYTEAVEKYDNDKWVETIELMEIAVDSWIQEYDKCRAFCDTEFDHGWLPDFTSSVANHYVFTLRCKRNCTEQLKFVNGRHYDDLYPSFYNYLQVAYYHAGKIPEAVKCLEAYSLFTPNSEEVDDNMKFYRNLPKLKDTDFQPREDAKRIYYQTAYERELLKFVDKEFPVFDEKNFSGFREF